MQNLKTGDILHCRGKGFLSWMIRWITNSEFNHTAVYIEIWGQPYIIEAQKNGVNVKHYDGWIRKYGYYYEAHRKPFYFDQREYSTRAMRKVGLTGYDFGGVIFRQPWLIITGNWHKKRNEGEKMYCSEYVMWTHGVVESYKMSPDDVYQYCKRESWIKL